MASASWLLLVIGWLGALDIYAYHTRAQRIRELPSARTELVAHCLRGPTYAALFLLIPNFALHGAAFSGLLALLVFDVAISIFDFAVERESRKPVGGLPTGEYILHCVIAGLFGAFCVCVFDAGRGWLELPTAIVFAPAVPDPIRWLMALMSIGVAVSGAQDGLAALRLGRGTHRTRAGASGSASAPA